MDVLFGLILAYLIGVFVGWFLSYSENIKLKREIKNLRKQLTFKAWVTPMIVDMAHSLFFWGRK